MQQKVEVQAATASTHTEGTRRLTVVIPSYNHAPFVAQAIRSVFAQTYRPLELVVVDDGSRDDSVRIIEKTLSEAGDVPAELVVQPNKGAHAALMEGLARARGELLSILNSDDWYQPLRFERLVPALGTSDVGLAFSGVGFVDGQNRPLRAANAWPKWWDAARRAHDLNPTVGFSLLVQNYSVTSGNFLFTRALYERLGGFGTQKLSHDWDFLVRSLYFTEPVYVPDPLMCYRVHGSNTTEGVRHLMTGEARMALERYRALLEAGAPPNRLAPCRRNWPSFFDLFLATATPFYGADVLRTILREAE